MMTEMTGIMKLKMSQKKALNQKMYGLQPFKYCKCLEPDDLSFIKKIAKLAIKNEKPKLRPEARLKPFNIFEKFS
jgi:hypothetical protein